MSYQGNNPYERREQQPSGISPQQQPQGTQPQQRQPQQTQQGQPTRTPSQQYQAPSQPQPQQQWQGQVQQPQRQQQQAQPQPSGMQQAQPQGGAMQQPQTGQQFTAPQAMTQTAGMQQQQQMERTAFKPEAVEELIVTDVVTAQRDTPIRTVVSSMAEHDVGSVVIVDDDGKTPIGIITDRKIAITLEGRPNIAEQNVEELLTGDLIAGTTSMTVFEALDKLNEAKIRRLPIVDDDGYLQGIVTLDDILVFLGAQLDSALEVISAQSRR